MHITCVRLRRARAWRRRRRKRLSSASSASSSSARRSARRHRPGHPRARAFARGAGAPAQEGDRGARPLDRVARDVDRRRRPIERRDRGRQGGRGAARGRDRRAPRRRALEGRARSRRRVRSRRGARLSRGALGVANFNVDRVDCVGKLTAKSDRAEIDVIRMTNGSRKYEFRACLRRGGKWYVSETTKGTCRE